ncbi:hypothetical protein [Micromonospora palythoicola]|uniref:hypothetical protein n=1 Tax=Micromonospora palythoicola TaxID=3120507 RepID=UPI002FCE3C61
MDGLTVDHVEEYVVSRGSCNDLRAQLKAGTFRPLPVRQRKIPLSGCVGNLAAPENCRLV